MPVVVILAAAGAGLAWLVHPYQLDDAYIAYRYAAHVAAGHGPTFNEGVPPTEGFTSPLWVAVLAAFARVAGGEALPTAAAVLGTACFFACIAVGYRIGRGRSPGDPAPENPWGAVTIVALLATQPSLTFYATTGMETLLFLLVVLVFASAAARELPSGWGLAAGAAGFGVRPEAGWLPVMAAAHLLAAGSWRKLFERRFLILAGSVVAGGTVSLAIRLRVFGLPLPLTFYAKGRDPVFGAGYVWRSLATPEGLGLLALAVAGAVICRPRHRGYLAGALAWLPAVVAEGGDWMPAGRLMVPVYGLLTLASSGLVRPRTTERTRAERSTARTVHALGVLAAVVAVLALQTRASVDLVRKAGRSAEGIRHEATFLADWVAASGAKSVCAVDIGLLGFRSGVEVVDLGGLTDPRIGLASGRHLEKDLDVDYVVRQRRPDVVVIRIEAPPERDPDGRVLYRPIALVERSLIVDRTFADLYRREFLLLPRDPARTPYYGKVIFVRNEFAPRDGTQLTDQVIRLQPRP